MHDLPFGQGQGQLLWLFSGTGEGPRLARAWLEQGWRLEVFVVSAAAARAYPPAPGFQVRVGPVGDQAALVRRLQAARAAEQAPAWIVDATHPFASRISADLAAVCAQQQQPLLRLVRPAPSGGQEDSAIVVPNLEALTAIVPVGERVLLAIGARDLARAFAALPERQLHARVLPTAESLALALASGLPSARLAALRPTGVDRPILGALCRQWAITTVIARESAGSTERCWRQVQGDLGLRLVLLQRPQLELPGVELTWPEALRRLSPGDDAPARRGIVGVGGPVG